MNATKTQAATAVAANPMLAIRCKCGWFREATRSITQAQAEVAAEMHEAANYRRAYRHDAVVEEVR